VGEATQRAIDPGHVRLPAGASGWHAVVRVEARPQYPDGVQPSHLGTKVTVSPAGLNLTTKGKICTLSVTLGVLPGLSGGCDLSNVGTQPLRVVHGRVVSEGRF